MHMTQSPVTERMILTISVSHPVTPASGALQGAGVANSGDFVCLLVLLFLCLINS